MDLPAALTDRVAFALQRALVHAQAMGELALGELDLAGREYGILALLEHGPVARQHELGATLGFDRTTTGKIVRGLVDRGLVRRTPLAGNGRALVLELTPAGEELRAAAAVRLRECDDRFTRPLTSVQRAQLLDALDVLLGHAGASPDGVDRPPDR